MNLFSFKSYYPKERRFVCIISSRRKAFMVHTDTMLRFSLPASTLPSPRNCSRKYNVKWFSAAKPVCICNLCHQHCMYIRFIPNTCRKSSGSGSKCFLAMMSFVLVSVPMCLCVWTWMLWWQYTNLQECLHLLYFENLETCLSFGTVRHGKCSVENSEKISGKFDFLFCFAFLFSFSPPLPARCCCWWICPGISISNKTAFNAFFCIYTSGYRVLWIVQQ